MFTSPDSYTFDFQLRQAYIRTVTRMYLDKHSLQSLARALQLIAGVMSSWKYRLDMSFSESLPQFKPAATA